MKKRYDSLDVSILKLFSQVGGSVLCGSGTRVGGSKKRAVTGRPNKETCKHKQKQNTVTQVSSPVVDRTRQNRHRTDVISMFSKVRR